jgi:hypothetical protein
MAEAEVRLARKTWSPEWLSVSAALLAAALAAVASGTASPDAPSHDRWLLVGGALAVAAVWVAVRFGRVDHAGEWLAEVRTFRGHLHIFTEGVATGYQRYRELRAPHAAALPDSFEAAVKRAHWPKHLPPASPEPVAQWTGAGMDDRDRLLFEFATAMYHGRPLGSNSVLASTAFAFDDFHAARRHVKDCLDEWGGRATGDADFAQFLEEQVRRYSDHLLLLAYLEIALAKALGTRTAPADNPLELGFWELGAKWCA